MAKTKSITTDRGIAAVKPGSARFAVRVAGARGLWLRISPKGLKVFELLYRSPGGQHRRLRLGEYPHCGLADAIKKAGKARAQIIDGGDPAGAKAAARIQAREGETLQDVLTAYLAAAKVGLHGGRKRPKTERTLSAEEGLFELHIAPKLGKLRAAEIRRPDIRSFMNTLASDSGLRPASVARIGEVLSSVFGYLVHIDQREDNPVRGLAHPLALTSRERRFDDAGIKLLWNTFCIHSVDHARGDGHEDELSRLAPSTALALRFALITLCRRTEAAGAEWREIDRKARLWEIPAGRTKSRRPRAVPLSDAALAILDAAAARKDKSAKFVFPAPADPSRPVAEERLTRAVNRLCARLGLPAGSPHDFRRSGSSTLTGLYGFRRFDIGCILGHQVNDGAAVTAVYDRHDYLDQMRAGLDCWAKHVTDLAEGREPTANVVPIRRRRGGA